VDRPCVHAIKCPGPAPGLEGDSPITNYSAEYNDGADFTGLSFPVWFPDDPGNPAWWTANSCSGLFECVSFISQDDADDCAKRLADICSYTPRLPTTGDPSCDVDPSSCVEAPPTLFYNTNQSCPFRCPDGSLFYWTIYAGTVVAESQELADKAAAALACERASRHWVCMSALTRPCKGVPYTGVISISGPDAPFVIALTSGTLPPGLSFVQTGPRVALIYGTPSTFGIFQITVQATSRFGNAVAKNYDISIMGITNSDPLPDATVGAAYSEQLIAVGGTAPHTFTIESGSLPTGLAMSITGLIDGTPTSPETQDIQIRITDSAGQSCVIATSLVATGVVCPTFLTDIAITDNNYGFNGFGETTNPLWLRVIFVGTATGVSCIDSVTNTEITHINYATIMRAVAYSPTQEKVFVGGDDETIRVINAFTLANLATISNGPAAGNVVIYNAGDDKVYYDGVIPLVVPPFTQQLAVTRASCATYAIGASDSYIIGDRATDVITSICPIPAHNTVLAACVISPSTDRLIQVYDYADLSTGPLATEVYPFADYISIQYMAYVASKDVVYCLFRRPTVLPGFPIAIVLGKVSPLTGVMISETTLANDLGFGVNSLTYLESLGMLVLCYQDGFAQKTSFYDVASDSILCSINDVSCYQAAQDNLNDIYIPDTFTFPNAFTKKYTT